uniref:(California timema) hypothetical protein n=1 Tax=Timema californicum TaxID=61474 RepID=A0A7R9JGH2_TIMCA|nr:unnamed protein product [Timema californicum]
MPVDPAVDPPPVPFLVWLVVLGDLLLPSTLTTSRVRVPCFGRCLNPPGGVHGVDDLITPYLFGRKGCCKFCLCSVVIKTPCDVLLGSGCPLDTRPHILVAPNVFEVLMLTQLSPLLMNSSGKAFQRLFVHELIHFFELSYIFDKVDQLYLIRKLDFPITHKIENKHQPTSSLITVFLLMSHQLHASLKKLASSRFRSRHGIGGSNKSPTYRRAGIHKTKHQSTAWQKPHGHSLHQPRKMVGHRSNNHLSTMDAPAATVIHRNLRKIPGVYEPTNLFHRHRLGIHILFILYIQQSSQFYLLKSFTIQLFIRGQGFYQDLSGVLPEYHYSSVCYS